MIETTIAIAIVTGLSEVIKQATDFPNKLTGLVGIGLALGVVFLFGGDNSWQELTFTGIIVGLAASGFYSNTKSVKEYVTK